MDMKDAYISIVGNIKCKEREDKKFKIVSYDTGTIGLINEDAKLLLDLCTGKNRIRDIIKIVSNKIFAPENEIEIDVMNSLKHLKLLKLVDTEYTQLDLNYNYSQYMYNGTYIYDHLFIEDSEVKYGKYMDFIKDYMAHGLFAVTLRINKNIDEDLKKIITYLIENNTLINIVWRDGEIENDLISIIKDNHLRGSFIFELLGSDNNLHNIKSKIDFETTIKNINKINDCGIDIDIVSMADKDNITDVARIIKLAAVLKCRAIYFQTISDNLKDEFNRIKELTVQELYDAYKYLPEVNIGMWGGSKSIEKLAKLEELIIKRG